MALSASQVEHYRQKLIALRDEMASATVRAESEVPNQDDLNHFDSGDKSVADDAKDDYLRQAGRDSQQLQDIETALARIKGGSYGSCDVCGMPIPESRLNAVPWTTLCAHDQEIADRRRRGGMSGGAPSRVVI